MKRKDSEGNPLPEINSAEDTNAQQLMLSFLLAVEYSLREGHHVVYDKDTKTAYITKLSGFISTVSH